MLGRKRKFKKLSKSEPSFLSKLYQILTEKEYSQYIHWSQDGLSVIISDQTNLTKKVLPKFYNHHNYASFVRQLNMYNFHKVRTDPKSNEQKYVHSEFHKGKTAQEIQEIRRKIKTDDDKEKNNKMILEKKYGNNNIINNNNNLDDKLFLDKIDTMEDRKKFEEYQNLIKNGELSKLSNDKILSFLLEKLRQNEENKKNFENEINNLTNQNKTLLQQLQLCNNKLVTQKDFCQKMKGLVLFLVTLVRRKNQNYKICRIDFSDGRDNNNKNKITNLEDLVRKYLRKKELVPKIIANDKKKENSITSTNNISLGNININKKQNKQPIIQKGENFTINNDDLSHNLITCSNNMDESFRDNNDLSLSFNKNFNIDLDLKKGNSLSSINLFGSSQCFSQKK